MIRRFRGSPILCALLLLTGCTTSADLRPIALVGGTVFPDPQSAPVEDAVIVLEGGRITEVGARAGTRIPRNAEVVDIAGMSVLAGFWNSHVHFMEPVWQNATTSSADSLSAALQAMLLRWGFIRVVDTGSPLENTLALRERIRKR